MPDPEPSPKPRAAPTVRPDGTLAIERRGLPRAWRETLWADSYHALRRMSWPRLFAVFALLFVATNLVFAAVLYLGDAEILNARPSSFWDRFHFSVQTLATIGYGYMAPGDALAHWVVTVESFCGILITAVTTGLVFAKFGTTTAKVLWSRTAVISRETGVPTLQFRMANARSSAIVEATVRVSLSWTEHLPSGEVVRRIYDLPLRRATSPMFALSWTVFHTIDSSSPLHDATPAMLDERAALILVTFTGIDDALATAVHARVSYPWDRVQWNHRYADILLEDRETGARYLDYSRFHDTVPDDAPR